MPLGILRNALNGNKAERRKMILVGNLLGAIGWLLDSVLSLFMFLLIARAVISWVSPDPSNFLVQFNYGTTEPVLVPIRKRVKPMGMLDLSVIVALLAIGFLKMFLVKSIVDYSHTLM